MGIWYRTGTASVANGSAAVTGTTTAFLANVKPGDGITFDAGATWYEVLSIASNTALTLATNYAGTTVSGGAYATDRRSPKWTWPSEFEKIVELLANVATTFTGTGAPAASLGSDRSVYLDTAGPTVYWKEAGAWSVFVGAAGPAGVNGATIRTGTGAPAGGLGVDGDLYIDTAAGTLYGVKTAGSWGSGVSLRGIQGIQGIQGVIGVQGIQGIQGVAGKQILNGAAAPVSGDGLDGDYWIETTNSRLYGPKAAGAWPGTYVSLIGPQGATGATGAAGAAGSTVEVWGLAVTAASGALTVALKRPDGSDPSGGSPVSLAFKNSTLSSGSPPSVVRSSALSQVLTSGSTLGAVANSPLRIWFLAINDGGTMRIGAVNCRSADGSVFAIDEGVVISTFAEGGAGGADSQGIIYSSAAVASKAIRILGYAQWNAGLATPGTWTAPDVVHVFTAGSKKPGDVVAKYNKRIAGVFAGSTLLPMDGTIPQSTEGILIGFNTYTPAMPANMIEIEARVFATHTAVAYLTAALFKAAEASAIGAGAVRAAAAYSQQILASAVDVSGVVSIPYQLRVGANVAGTITVNGIAGVQYLGGAMLPQITVTETMA